MIGEISAVGVAFLWSSTSIMVKSASDRMTILSLNALRVTSGALFVVIALFVAGKAEMLGQINLAAIAYLVGSVVIGMGVGDTLYFRSMALVGISRAAPVSNIYPLFTLPFALLFLGEGVTWLNALGMLVAVAGVYLVARSSGSGGTFVARRRERFRYEGVLMALAAALCWALSTAIIKPALLETDIFVANSVRLPAAALVLLMFAAKSGARPSIRACGWRSLLLAGAAGVISIGVGGLLFLTAVQEAGAAKAAALSSVSPLFSIPLSMIFFGERLTVQLAMGAVLTVAGIWLIV